MPLPLKITEGYQIFQRIFVHPIHYTAGGIVMHHQNGTDRSAQCIRKYFQFRGPVTPV